MTDPTISPNTHVVVDYELRDEKGQILDASETEGGEPIEYVHGYGMLVPGLEAALAGLKVGDEREVVVPAAAGYGEYDKALVLEIDRGEFPDPAKVEVGDEFVAESPDGDEIAMNVIELKDDVVVVDANNHPLAGDDAALPRQSPCGFRAATEAEVEGAAADLDDAHEHVHGPDCDHDHGESPAILGRTKPN